MALINLQTSDGKIFPVPRDVACHFGVIRTMINDLGEENVSHDSNLPLFNVDSETLMVLLEWAYDNPDDSAKFPTYLCPPDDPERQIVLEPYLLMKLVQAIDYLDAEYILEYNCFQLATLVMDKSFKEMKKNFKFDYVAQDLEE